MKPHISIKDHQIEKPRKVQTCNILRSSYINFHPIGPGVVEKSVRKVGRTEGRTDEAVSISSPFREQKETRGS